MTHGSHPQLPLTSALQQVLGKEVELPVVRMGPPGAFLSLGHDDPPATVLLPRREIPEGLAVGQSVRVFVYLDSEDRPVATTQKPQVTLGCVAFLRVTDTTHFGAFADWGLVKDLLLPMAEQTKPVKVGDVLAVGLMIDRTGRLTATMRVAEMLEGTRQFVVDEWVDGCAWRRDPGIGVFVIVEQRYVGLLPLHEPHNLKRGESARFRVASVLPDGKIELSLRRHAHQEVDHDGERILQVLATQPALKVGDHSSPSQIRAVFAMSKKAFKRAVGSLLKGGRVQFDDAGCLRVPSPNKPTGR